MRYFEHFEGQGHFNQSCQYITIYEVLIYFGALNQLTIYPLQYLTVISSNLFITNIQI